MIQLTHATLQATIRVNPDHIIMYFRQKDADQTVIDLQVSKENRALGVVETPEEIDEKINQFKGGK